jgi:hypothetical protein
MTLRQRWHILGRSPTYRLVMFIIGCALMIASPLAGILPGPGGIIVFAIGLGMALRSSIWAKRNYVRLKRKQPKIGEWTDWGMRRPSAKRRTERNKAKKAQE